MGSYIIVRSYTKYYPAVHIVHMKVSPCMCDKVSTRALFRSHVSLSLIWARSLEKKVMDSSGDEQLFEVRCS